ncbi:MAG: hypothetical protein N3I35_02760 [Clostridia bacterium]|nr:hypothetical protein [Clostridia bacterium]
MVKVVFGRKGMGKTKILVEEANKLAVESSGDIVFIDDSSHLMYDLKHEVRFINVSEFPLVGSDGFLGFVCGIISEDYDIDAIFIDGLTYILKQKVDTLEGFFKNIEQISEKYNIKFYFSINSETGIIPEFLREYVTA